MMNLPQDLAFVGSNQSQLARHIGVSRAAVTQIVKYRIWPATRGLSEKLLRERISAYLTAKGLPAERLARTFDEAPAAPRANAELQAMAKANNSGPQPGNTQGEDDFMLRHYKLTPEARRHFKIPRDPFVDEMRDERDVFVTDDIRYVRSAMRQTAKFGGMLAVSAESGGGKSILRKDLNQWIADSGEPITVIEPLVLGMAANERDGTPLKAADIVASVIRTVAPGVPLRQRLDDRSDQMRRILQGSTQLGRRHVVIIEEAHALAKPTIKCLKRFYELEDGFKKMLAIMLIGQTKELEEKLNESDPEVREVVQRCELIRLPPLDNHVGAYLQHKFARVDVDVAAVLEPAAIDAIRDVLRTSETGSYRGKRETREKSLCCPLAVNNLVTRAMNEAVKISAPKVSAPLIVAAAREF